MHTMKLRTFDSKQSCKVFLQSVHLTSLQVYISCDFFPFHITVRSIYAHSLRCDCDFQRPMSNISIDKLKEKSYDRFSFVVIRIQVLYINPGSLLNIFTVSF